MTITLTWQTVILGFLAICGGFTTVCVAGGWFIKIVKGLKKPSDDVKARLQSQDEKIADEDDRIKDLEKQFKFVLKAISLLLQDDLAILNHLRTDNNTGEMAKQENKVQEFLIQR